jgi:hypothetical protein
MNILAAIRDPHVFGNSPATLPTWAAWRAFLAALFALNMSDAEAEIYRTCTGRAALPTTPHREAWLVCGRRAGKSNDCLGALKGSLTSRTTPAYVAARMSDPLLRPPLRRLQREQDPKSPFVFTSMRDSPFTTAGFRKMVARLGVAAKFDFLVHPHMLRHACGYKLANDGVDTRSLQVYLGHKNIQHTCRYTELSPKRFKDFWRD